MRRLSRGRCSTASLAVYVLVAAPTATASYGVTTNAASPSLRVDARGNAEVAWTERGRRRTFIVPSSGQGHYGALSGADVSTPATAPIPMKRIVRRTPDGTLWALQEWNTTRRPKTHDLARWKGTPTQLTLSAKGTRLTGTATFQGRPVTGSNKTPTGKSIRITVFLECFGCPGGRSGWSSMLGVAPKGDGSFAVFLRPTWQGSRYRATVAGPNVDGELAPDAQVTVSR